MSWYNKVVLDSEMVSALLSITLPFIGIDSAVRVSSAQRQERLCNVRVPIKPPKNTCHLHLVYRIASLYTSPHLAAKSAFVEHPTAKKSSIGY